MTTTNLYQSSNEESSTSTIWSRNKGFFFSLGMIVLTFMVLFGLKALVAVLEKRQDSLQKEIDKERNSLVKESNFGLIADIISRINLIKNNLNIKNGDVSRSDMKMTLSYVEKALIPEIYLSSYTYTNNNEASVIFVSNNFNDAARQVLSFKKMAEKDSEGNFSGASLENISRKEKGIECTMKMGITTAKK